MEKGWFYIDIGNIRFHPLRKLSIISIVTYLRRCGSLDMWYLRARHLQPSCLRELEKNPNNRKKSFTEVARCHDMWTRVAYYQEKQNSFYGTENGHPVLPCHHAWKKPGRDFVITTFRTVITSFLSQSRMILLYYYLRRHITYLYFLSTTKADNSYIILISTQIRRLNNLINKANPPLLHN